MLLPLNCAECLLLGELSDAITIYGSAAVCAEHLADSAQDRIREQADLNLHVRHALRQKLPRPR